MKVFSIFESIFGEGLKITSLDAKQLGELRDEARTYLNDWPLEALSTDFTVDGNTTDDDFFQIENVRGLVSLLADGLGWDLEKPAIKDSDIQSIFSILKGLRVKVESDHKKVLDNGGSHYQDVDYDLEITGWKYDHSKDEIDLKVKISKLIL